MAILDWLQPASGSNATGYTDYTNGTNVSKLVLARVYTRVSLDLPLGTTGHTHGTKTNSIPISW